MGVNKNGRWLALLFLMNCISWKVSAQETYAAKKDSLLNLISKVTDPHQRKEIHEELLYIYINENLDEGLRFAVTALEDAVANKNEEQYAEFTYQIGKIHLAKGNYDSCLVFFREAAEKFSLLNDMEGFANTIESVALRYQDTGENKTAILYHQKARDLFQKINDPVGIGHVYINIGNIYKYQENLDKALSYYLKAKDSYSLHTDKRYLPLALNNIGIYYKEDGQLDTAEFLFSEAIKIQEEFQLTEGLANSLNNLAGVYFQDGDLKKCRETLIRSIEIKKSLGDEAHLPGGYMNLSYIFSEEQRFSDALDALDKAEYYAKIHKNPFILQNIMKSKADLFNSMGRVNDAFSKLQEYTEFRDSLMSSENRSIAEELEKKYENDKIKKENLILNQEKQLQENQLAVQAQSQKILGGLLLFSLIIVTLIFFGYRNKKKTNHLLSLKNIIIEEKNKEIVDSIQYAKRLQKAILPSDQEVKSLLPESFILYKPKDIVAGDFYFIEKINGKIIVAAADCTGHGVPGAMVSVVCFNALVRTIKEYGITEPGRILDKVSELVEETFSKSGEDVKDGMDISLAVMDPEKDELCWAGANNPLWIIRQQEAEPSIIEIKPDKQPVGKYHRRAPFTTHALSLQKEDRIYLFSDGYADQFGGNGKKKFKLSGMREILMTIYNSPMDQQKLNLLSFHESWKGSLEQIDDICVIGVKWEGSR